MSGNYDDIIRQVLAARGTPAPKVQPDFSDEDVELLPYPVHTAKVPPDTMRDTPFYASVPPDVGNETTTKIRTNQSLEADQQVARMRAIGNQMQTMAAGPHDSAAFDQLMQEFNALDTAQKAYTGRGRAIEAEIKQQTPIDADVMMKAIANRRQLGRSE